MDRYKRLIKKRERSLAIFNKIVAKLEKLMAKMRAEIDASNEEILELERQMADEKEAIKFLNEEHGKTLAQAEKIKGIFA